MEAVELQRTRKPIQRNSVCLQRSLLVPVLKSQSNLVDPKKQCGAGIALDVSLLSVECVLPASKPSVCPIIHSYLCYIYIKFIYIIGSF